MSTFCIGGICTIPCGLTVIYSAGNKSKNHGLGCKFCPRSTHSLHLSQMIETYQINGECEVQTLAFKLYSKTHSVIRYFYLKNSKLHFPAACFGKLVWCSKPNERILSISSLRRLVHIHRFSSTHVACCCSFSSADERSAWKYN